VTIKKEGKAEREGSKNGRFLFLDVLEALQAAEKTGFKFS